MKYEMPVLTEQQLKEAIHFHEVQIASWEMIAKTDGSLSDHCQLLLLSARIALAALTAEPTACKRRLVNHRSGVEYSWTYQGLMDYPSQGDIFRVEVVPLYERPAPAINLVPDGWVAVPLEPTEEMIAAWRDDMDKSYAKEHAIKIGEDEIVFAHQAMLAAAPSFPHTAPIGPICATGGAENKEDSK